MKMLIVLALFVGMAASASIGSGVAVSSSASASASASSSGTVLKAISVKKYDHLTGEWVVTQVVRDMDKMNKIKEEQGDNLNVVMMDEDGCAPIVGDVEVGPDLGVIDIGLPEIEAPCDIVIPEPCGDVLIPTQTKIAAPCRTVRPAPCRQTRQPCQRGGIAPVTVMVDGYKWKCTVVGRTARPCVQRSLPCEAPEIVIVDRPAPCIIEEPCIEEKIIIEPCVAEEIKIIEEPCGLPVIEVIEEPCIEEKVIFEPCVDVKVIEPCVSKFEMPCLGGFMDKLKSGIASLKDASSSVATCFSSSSSSSASASSSSSFSHSFSSGPCEVIVA